VKVPPEGFHPAVGLHSDGEEVQLNLDAEFVTEESMLMAIDLCEEEWRRLHDVRLCGQVGVRIVSFVLCMSPVKKKNIKSHFLQF
jgi:hypothetical protein